MAGLVIRHNVSGAVVGDSAIGSISPGNPTDPGTPVTAQPSPSPTGFFGELKNTAKQILTGAPAWPLARRSHNAAITMHKNQYSLSGRPNIRRVLLCCITF